MAHKSYTKYVLLAVVNELLTKAKEVAKGKSLAEAGIDVKWVLSYGVIARRCRDDKDFGVTPYPYEQGHGVGRSPVDLLNAVSGRFARIWKSTRAYGQSRNKKRSTSTSQDTGWPFTRLLLISSGNVRREERGRS